MTDRIATVIPDDGLRLRKGPSTGAEILGLLRAGEQVTITARRLEWRRVECLLGAGYVHGDFITVDGATPVNDEPPGLDPEIPEDEVKPPDDRTGLGGASDFYTCEPGDTLSAIGSKLSLDWRDIAAVNGLQEPFAIHVNQVLRLPGAAVRTAAIEVGNPLEWGGRTLVTSSSAQGHHTPYGGNRSCDLAVVGRSNAGTAVRFNVRAPEGVEVRGVVRLIGPACRSGRLEDGGSKVQIAIQHRAAGGEWRDSGAWLLYGHLDPVEVEIDTVVHPGQRLGELGPAGGGEYDSSCAQGSHVHVEASRTASVINLGSDCGDRPVLSIPI